MRFFRGAILFLLALLPLATLFQHNDVGRWDVQRSAMAGPDEFSYLLMARHFLAGGGLSLQQELGRDTYFPPGYPLLIAAWAKIFFGGKVTAFAAHALNTLLLCIDVPLAYLLSCRWLAMLQEGVHRRFLVPMEMVRWLALLIAAIFAANWHVLETSLLVMSEPAFMLVTFLWLLLALRWPRWNERVPRTLAMTCLAVAAWSIRGAGIVTVACTAAFPLLILARDLFLAKRVRAATIQRWLAVGTVLLIPLVYQVTLTKLSPEKSVASGEESANSYPRQLLHGLTAQRAPLPPLELSLPADYPKILANLGGMVLAHFNDYASSFVPWPRENPDFHFRDLIGKLFGFLALVGFLAHAVRLLGTSPAHRDAPVQAQALVTAFVGLYVVLYLIWPFDFARFWSPVLPVMLAFAASCVLCYPEEWPGFPRWSIAAAMLFLLAVLSLQEVDNQVGNYARRLNYVSDALADAARVIVRHSPDPARATVAGMGADELFAMGWYVGQDSPGMRVVCPLAHRPEAGGREETPPEMLIRLSHGFPRLDGGRLFFVSYFDNADGNNVVADVLKLNPGAIATRILRREIIVSVWELRPADLERPETPLR